MTTELKFHKITGRVISAAYEVHAFLGIGFPEVIYQKALAIEMQKKELTFKREYECQIYYKDSPKPIGSRRVDFMVEEKVLVELKAIPNLDEDHFIQLQNYLKIYKIEVGLLINFGSRELQVKRLNTP